MRSFDVGIVGAGIHGAAAAFHLASRGVRPVVIDERFPAGGPTGRSSAICRAYYTNEFLARVARDAIEMFEHLSELTGGRDAAFRRTGALFLHGPGDTDRVGATAARLTALGVPTDVLDPGALAQRFPWLDPAGIGIGAWERNAGYADPAATTTALFDRAVELGAEHRLGRSVVEIEPLPTGGALLRLSGGRSLACGRLLIAAGPWTRPLARMAGADLPLTVERHVVGAYRWGSAPPVPLHGDLALGYYLKPEGQELFLLGSLHPAPQADPNHFSERASDRELLELAVPAIARVPALMGAETQQGWASLYDVSPDWQPVIGEIAPGIFVDAGTSGHGFKIAPALGRHVADLVTGEATDPGLAQFDPFRFEGGRPLVAGYGKARILG